MGKPARAPSLIGVIIVAIISMILGFVIAFVVTAAQPVKVEKQMPAELERRTVYFVPGPDKAAPHADAKMKALAEGAAGTTVALSDAELNAWAKKTLKPAARKANEPAPAVELEPPNFRIIDDKLQVAVTFKAVKPPAPPAEKGMEEEKPALPESVVFFAVGSFESVNGQVIFMPTRAYMNSARVPNMFGLAATAGALEAYKQHFEPVRKLTESWGSVKSVQIVNGELHIAR